MSSPIIDGGNAYSTYAAPTGVTSPDLTGAVFSPTVQTSTTKTPYVTSAEFEAAGTGCDVGQLVPGGSTGANAAALAQVIREASAWADNLCHKTLAATLDIQAGRYLSRDGMISIALKLAPVVAVQALSVGPRPFQLTDVTLTSATAAIQPPALLQLADPYLAWEYGSGYGRGFYRAAYVNGYGPCTTLAGSTAVGDTTLNLAQNLGVAPGMVLTLDDGGSTEQVTVSPSYVIGAAGPVPLAAPVTAVHATGIAAAAMPQDIRRAVISLTACLIKTRGNESFEMGQLGSPPSKTALSEAGGIEDFELAADLLEQYRRVW